DPPDSAPAGDVRPAARPGKRRRVGAGPGAQAPGKAASGYSGSQQTDGTVSQTTEIGMARPIPSACWAFSVATPTTSFLALNTGPPELPGLMAASNCISCSPLRVRNALTTPVVTVSSRPIGEPMTSTGSPTLGAAEAAASLAN